MSFIIIGFNSYRLFRSLSTDKSILFQSILLKIIVRSTWIVIRIVEVLVFNIQKSLHSRINVCISKSYTFNFMSQEESLLY